MPESIKRTGLLITKQAVEFFFCLVTPGITPRLFRTAGFEREKGTKIGSILVLDLLVDGLPTVPLRARAVELAVQAHFEIPPAVGAEGRSKHFHFLIKLLTTGITVPHGLIIPT